MVNRTNYKLVKQYLKYLEEVEQLSIATLQRYWFYLRHLLLWANENHLSKSPTIRPTFPAYVLSLTRWQGSGSLAGATQKKILGAAKRFFVWTKMSAVKDFARLSMPWIETLRSPRQINPSSDHIFVSVEEAVNLASFPVDGHDLALRRDQAAAAMLFLSGARSTAFTTLPVQAVDIKAGCIYQWPELGVRTKNMKKATTYLLPIPQLMKVVDEWDTLVKDSLPPTAPWYTTINHCWGDQEFTHRTPGKNRSQMLRKRLKGLFDIAGLEYKSAHKFRHGHAVYGLQHARTMADYKAVSINLMHEDIKITDEIYAPILSNEVQLRINHLVDHTREPKENDVKGFVRDMSNRELSEVMRIVAERLAR